VRQPTRRQNWLFVLYMAAVLVAMIAVWYAWVVPQYAD
jgi:polyferredoxin